MSNVITERTPSWLAPVAVSTTYASAKCSMNDDSLFVDTVNTDNQSANNSVWSDKCDDGTDDGKLTFGSAACSFLKGAGKSLINTVKGIVTDPKKLLLTVATAAVCIAFPPAGVALGVAGAAMGACKVIDGAVQAYDIYHDESRTDAEAKAAFEDMGAGTLQFGLSLVAVKGSLGAMKSTQGSAMSTVTKSSEAGLKGFAENTANYSKAFLKDTVSGGRGLVKDANGGIHINSANAGYKGTQMLTSLKSSVSSNGGIRGTIGNGISNAGEAVRSGEMLQNARSTASGAFAGARQAVSHPIANSRAVFGTFSNAAKSAGYSSSISVLANPAAAANASYNAENSNLEMAQYEQYQKQMAEYANGYNTDFTQLTSRTTSGTYDFGIDYSDVEAAANKVMLDFMTNI